MQFMSTVQREREAGQRQGSAGGVVRAGLREVTWKLRPDYVAVLAVPVSQVTLTVSPLSSEVTLLPNYLFSSNLSLLPISLHIAVPSAWFSHSLSSSSFLTSCYASFGSQLRHRSSERPFVTSGPDWVPLPDMVCTSPLPLSWVELPWFSP